MRNLICSLTIICLIMSCQKDNLQSDESYKSENLTQSESTTELESRSSDHSVFGKVWEDHDGDGIQDFSDNGLPEIIVLLKSLTDSITVQEYVTDGTGEYYFDIENEGDYFIKIGIEQSYPDYIATIDLTSMSFSIESLDSDVTHEFGLNTSSSFPNDYKEKLDFGFYKGGAIGNQVWLDNENSMGGIPNVFDGGDDPVSGATIKLYSINQMTDVETFIDSTTTNNTGNYLFQNIPSGDFIVEVRIEISALNNSLRFASPKVGDDDSRDSNIVEVMNFNAQKLIGRTGFISIKPGEVNLDTDIGIKDQSAVICFFPPGAFLTSGAGGSASPNGTVWIDSNADGFLKGNEPTMEGVTVNLLNSENDSIIQTVLTDNNGYYEFDRINNRIANCYLQISQPTGYMLTKNVNGACYPINDFHQKTRKTVEFRTSACPYYSSYDAGLVEGVFMLGRKE